MKCLVTGAGGFLGLALTKELLTRGHTVRTFQRGTYPALAALGTDNLQGDLADPLAISSALRDIDIVYHVAAKPGVWGSYQDFYSPNVLGTQNLLHACARQGVTKLVYTSSPSVVFDGRDENGIDESAPYPRKFLAHYPRTKARAEQLVLAANSPRFSTVALRPHLIWGPGDPNLIPRILARARAGRLRLIGPGSNLVDSTYIDNAARAHILAGERLAPHAPCAGKAYFISNGEPLPMGELIQRILTAAGMALAVPTMNVKVAYAMGTLLELTHRVFRPKVEPLLTRFVVRQLSTAHWFNLAVAQRDLGYQPTVSIDEGMTRLARALQQPTNPLK